jgi:rubrerythrin
MSTNSSDKKPGEYVMPEKFSFGLEERDESEEEIELPESQQTLISEDKKIWTCPTCGALTNTYTWQKP